MLRVCIDPGHGGHDPGATYKGLSESNVVLTVARNLRDLLQLSQDGFEVVMTRDEDVYVSLAERARTANQARANVFVSLHCNADPDSDLPGMPEARGEEIWFYKGSGLGEHVAEILEWAMRTELPNEPFRGRKPTESLYVLGPATDMPAVLLELGFIDNSNTVLTFGNELLLRSLGWVVAKGLCAVAWNWNK